MVCIYPIAACIQTIVYCIVPYISILHSSKNSGFYNKQTTVFGGVILLHHCVRHISS